MQASVRVIMPYEYRGAQGNAIGIPLLLQHHHPKFGYSYVLPGGTLEKTDTSKISRLALELKQECGIEVQPADLHWLYDYQGPSRLNHIFYLERVTGGRFTINTQENNGLGFMGLGPIIPKDLLAGHVAKLPDNFYHKFGRYLRPTKGLVIPQGYFDEQFRDPSISKNIITWENQKKLWRSWEAEVRALRGFPPLNKS